MTKQGDFCKIRYLAEMVEHKLGDSGSPPFRVSEDEGNVGLGVSDVRHHEGEGDDELAVDDDAAEVGVLKTFRH